MLKNKRIDPRDTETVEWGELISETKTCVEFEELPGRYGIRTSQIFNDAEIDVFVGEYETSLDRITSGNPSETEFYASGGMAYIIVNAAHVGQDIRADYYPGGSVLTAEVLDSEDFKGPQGDTGPQGPTGPAGAPGDVSNVENVGAGVGVFKEIATGTARFKSLVAGANINFDTTDPDEIEISVDAGGLVGDAITDASAATLADADEFGFWHVGAGLRKITWANIKATLKTYFDTLYAPTGQGVKTYITAQATAARVTSAAPDAIGEYRSYLRNAGARTYTETNGTPGTAPSSSNGYRMYISAVFATADASGEPSRYEIYIGLNKDPAFEFYSSTGRTGLIFTKPFQRWGGLDVNGGIETHYDPTTGIARVIHQPCNGGNNYTGLDFSGELVTADIYFDIKC